MEILNCLKKKFRGAVRDKTIKMRNISLKLLSKLGNQLVDPVTKIKEMKTEIKIKIKPN